MHFSLSVSVVRVLCSHCEIFYKQKCTWLDLIWLKKQNVWMLDTWCTRQLKLCLVNRQRSDSHAAAWLNNLSHTGLECRQHKVKVHFFNSMSCGTQRRVSKIETSVPSAAEAHLNSDQSEVSKTLSAQFEERMLNPICIGFLQIY